MTTETEKRLVYDINTASKMLGISRNLAYKLAKNGTLPGVIPLGKRYMVSSAILDRLLKPNEQ